MVIRLYLLSHHFWTCSVSQSPKTSVVPIHGEWKICRRSIWLCFIPRLKNLQVIIILNMIFLFYLSEALASDWMNRVCFYLSKWQPHVAVSYFKLFTFEQCSFVFLWGVNIGFDYMDWTSKSNAKSKSKRRQKIFSSQAESLDNKANQIRRFSSTKWTTRKQIQS